jgi:hypothetical protein
MTLPTVQQDPTAAAIMATYLAATAVLRSRLLGIVAAAYASETNNYGDAAATAFVAQVVPAVQAAQQTMAALTSAYLSHLISSAAGGTAAPVGVPVGLLEAVRGVDPAEVYRRPYVQVWIDLSRGKDLQEAVAAGGRRAASLAATDLQLAKTKASQIVMADDRRVIGYRRVLVGSHSCGMCVVASTVRYRKSNLMPIHPGCVPETTLVKAFNISGATRRRYSGKLSIITTAVGDQVAVTPNHPVFTDRGWLAASHVRPGDYILNSSPAEGVIGGSPNKSHRPIFAKDVWRSLAMTFGFIEMPLATEDFHGDGSDNKVDVVWSDGYFSAVGDLQFLQTSGEDSFMTAERRSHEFTLSRVPAALVPSSSSSTSSVMGRGRLRGALLGGHLCCAHEAGLRSTSSGDLSISQPTSYDIARYAPAMRDDVFCEAMGGVVGMELFHRVSHVGRTDFAGHVINFQTRSGRYESDSHIVHNCDCAVAPLMGHKFGGRTIDSAILKEGSAEKAIGTQGMKFFEHDDVLEVGDLLEPAHKAIEDAFGKRATNAQSIDYRKVILVRNHSEMGPLLTVADHKFTEKQIDSGNLRAKTGTFHKSKGREITNIEGSSG